MLCKFSIRYIKLRWFWLRWVLECWTQSPFCSFKILSFLCYSFTPRWCWWATLTLVKYYFVKMLWRWFNFKVCLWIGVIMWGRYWNLCWLTDLGRWFGDGTDSVRSSTCTDCWYLLLHLLSFRCWVFCGWLHFRNMFSVLSCIMIF